MDYRVLERFLQRMDSLFEDIFDQISVRAREIELAEPWILHKIYYAIVGYESWEVLIRAEYYEDDAKLILRCSQDVVGFDEGRANLLYLEQEPRYASAELRRVDSDYIIEGIQSDNLPYAVVLYNVKEANTVYKALASWLPGSNLLEQVRKRDYEEWARRVRAAYELLVNESPFNANSFLKYLSVISGVPIALHDGLIVEVQNQGADALVRYSGGQEQLVSGYGSKVGLFRQGQYVAQYEPLTMELEVLIDGDAAI